MIVAISEVSGEPLGTEPKTRRSKRSVPVARNVMRQIDEHLHDQVGPNCDALVFAAAQGGPLLRDEWQPSVKKAQLSGVTFHTLRHSFVAIWSPPDATCERFLNGPAAAAWRLL